MGSTPLSKRTPILVSNKQEVDKNLSLFLTLLIRILVFLDVI